ncbi:MAG: hypothetical protein HUU22_11135 [Phycisphaerae bacterium]|nr:GDSL-type esterase/lipase family protein [Phycisphaerae bacterium]NUQ46575.1 hypothetical protein [Phycisphaerae bacterium]
MSDGIRTLSWRRKLLFSVFTTVVLFALCEGAARVYLRFGGADEAPIRIGFDVDAAVEIDRRNVLYRADDACFFRLRPNIHIPEHITETLFDIRTNSFGMRSPEISREKPPGALRVLCLGDSCTFGTGAGQNDTFPAQLERELRGRLEGRAVEVINAGVPGFSSFQARMLLESEGWSFSPDAVVLTVGCNDRKPARPDEKRVYDASKFLGDREYHALAQRRNVLALTRVIGRWLAPRGLSAEAELAAQQSGKRRVPVPEYREELIHVVEACRRRGVVPVIVVWALYFEADPSTIRGRPLSDHNRSFAEYQAMARQVAREKDVPLADVPKVVAGTRGLYADGVHLNATGYGLVAREIADVLMPKLQRPAD